MSGHSKWANIKNRKGAQDKKRSEAFTKVAKDILTAVRTGGGNTNPEANNSLRVAIEKARSVNMPKENIERLLKRFDERKANLVSVTLEGYAPFGVPIVVEAETDNKNRTLAEIKLIFRDSEGVLGDEGSVMYQFERLGEVEFETAVAEDQMLELIDEGAIDFDENMALIDPQRMQSFRQKADSMGLKIVKADFILRSRMPLQINEEQVNKIDEMVEALEENEDVINVFIGAQYE